jgi:GNAT superfamily N-acetyltransferase
LGTRLFGFQHRAEIVVLAAIHMRLHLAGELELQVNDLITLPAHRRKGFGSEMMKYLEGFAHKNRCFRLILHSGVQNSDAHRFYVERSGFREHGIVFIKELRKLS